MERKSWDDLGELQRAVLERVWELGEADVHAVRERLNRRKKKLASGASRRGRLLT